METPQSPDPRAFIPGLQTTPQARARRRLLAEDNYIEERDNALGRVSLRARDVYQANIELSKAKAAARKLGANDDDIKDAVASGS